MTNFDKSSADLQPMEKVLAEITVLNHAVHHLLVHTLRDTSEPQALLRGIHDRGQATLRLQTFSGIPDDRQALVKERASGAFSAMIARAVEAVGG